jgi:Raf kinase inhibitor-like YbhB/YbcL family protein
MIFFLHCLHRGSQSLFSNNNIIEDKKMKRIILIFIFIFLINKINILGGSMKLASTSYQDNQSIPVKYTNIGVSGGQNVSPQFSWSEFPDRTKSFVLAIIDIHPIASNWVHWMLIDIPSNIISLDENCSNTSRIPLNSKELINSFGKKGYGGAQPPKGSGKHEYVATIYALDTEKINLSGQISETELLREIKSHILDKAVLSGFFSR